MVCQELYSRPLKALFSLFWLPNVSHMEMGTEVSTPFHNPTSSKDFGHQNMDKSIFGSYDTGRPNMDKLIFH